MKNRLFSAPCFIALAVSTLALGSLGAETKYQPTWESLDQRPCPTWYLDAKFGIFMHWGIYSVPSWGAPKAYAEWYWNNMANQQEGNVWWQFHKKTYGEKFAYADFAPLFRCEFFNPDQWADLFQRSGAKYVAPTSKHHDGFAIWPSAEADRTWGRAWNSVSTGPKRDLLGELGTAVRKRGLKFGFYYSLYEWFNPLWRSDRKRYVTEHMIPQFKDVVTRYQPAIIFSDGEWDLTAEEWKSQELLAWLFNESPCRDDVVVNDRWGKGIRHKHGDYYTTEYGAGLPNATHPWEENRGMGYSYGFNRGENIDDYQSSRELILMFIDLVSRGGNLLLNIGPTGDGRIPVIMQDRLLQMGAWLQVNGEAIYGTRYAGRDCQWSDGKRPGQEFGEYKVKYELMKMIGNAPHGDRAVKQAWFTRKPEALYAITPGWPGSKLVLKNIRLPANPTVRLLGYPEPLRARMAGANLEIDLPNLSGDQLPCLYAYAFKIPGAELLPEPK